MNPNAQRLIVLLVLAFGALAALTGCQQPSDLKPAVYTVSYHPDGATGESPIDPKHYEAGEQVTVLGNGTLTRGGYTFAGWNTAADYMGTFHAVGTTFAMRAANVDLYAVWTQNPTYTVTYHNNEGSGTAPVDPNHYQAGDPVNVLGAGSLTRAGYTFAGWNTSADGQGALRAVGVSFAMGSTNVDLYAVWTQNPTYAVTYHANDGSGTAPVDPNHYQAGDSATVLGSGSLTRAGYTFAGWNTAADSQGTLRAVGTSFVLGTTNVDLFALWRPVQDTQLTIGFAPISYRAVSFSPGTLVTGQGEILHLAPSGTSWSEAATQWAWTLDGANLSSATSSALDLDTNPWGQGSHVVGVTMNVGGTLCSGSITVTISGSGGYTPWISLGDRNFGLGQSMAMTLTDLPSSPLVTLSWSSSDQTVATVDHQGNVTGVGYGDAVIAVTTNQGRGASVRVHIGRAALAASVPLYDPTKRTVSVDGVVDSAGNRYIASAEDSGDIRLVKTNAAGGVLWSNATLKCQANWSNYFGIAQIGSGDIIVVGALPGPFHRATSSGGVYSAYGPSGGYYPVMEAAAATPDGGFVTVGWGENGRWDYGNGVVVDLTQVTHPVPLVVKFGADLRAQWYRIPETATGGFGTFHAVAVAADGSIYAAGDIHQTDWAGRMSWSGGFGVDVPASLGPTGFAPLLMRLSAEGSVDWIQVPEYSAGRWGYISWGDYFGPVGWTDCAIAPDGTVVTTGVVVPNSYYFPEDSVSWGPGLNLTIPAPYSAGERMSVTMKHGTSGQALWLFSDDGSWPRGNEARSVAVDPNGQITVASGYGLRTLSAEGQGQSQTPLSIYSSSIDADDVALVTRTNGGLTLFGASGFTCNFGPGVQLIMPNNIQSQFFQVDYQ